MKGIDIPQDGQPEARISGKLFDIPGYDDVTSPPFKEFFNPEKDGIHIGVATSEILKEGRRAGKTDFFVDNTPTSGWPFTMEWSETRQQIVTDSSRDYKTWINVGEKYPYTQFGSEALILKLAKYTESIEKVEAAARRNYDRNIERLGEWQKTIAEYQPIFEDYSHFAWAGDDKAVGERKQLQQTGKLRTCVAELKITAYESRLSWGLGPFVSVRDPGSEGHRFLNVTLDAEGQPTIQVLTHPVRKSMNLTTLWANADDVAGIPRSINRHAIVDVTKNDKGLIRIVTLINGDEYFIAAVLDRRLKELKTKIKEGYLETEKASFQSSKKIHEIDGISVTTIGIPKIASSPLYDCRQSTESIDTYSSANRDYQLAEAFAYTLIGDSKEDVEKGIRIISHGNAAVVMVLKGSMEPGSGGSLIPVKRWQPVSHVIPLEEARVLYDAVSRFNLTRQPDGPDWQLKHDQTNTLKKAWFKDKYDISQAYKIPDHLGTVNLDSALRDKLKQAGVDSLLELDGAIDLVRVVRKRGDGSLFTYDDLIQIEMLTGKPQVEFASRLGFAVKASSDGSVTLISPEIVRAKELTRILAREQGGQIIAERPGNEVVEANVNDHKQIRELTHHKLCDACPVCGKILKELSDSQRKEWGLTETRYYCDSPHEEGRPEVTAQIEKWLSTKYLRSGLPLLAAYILIVDEGDPEEPSTAIRGQITGALSFAAGMNRDFMARREPPRDTIFFVSSSGFHYKNEALKRGSLFPYQPEEGVTIIDYWSPLLPIGSKVPTTSISLKKLLVSRPSSSFSSPQPSTLSISTNF